MRVALGQRSLIILRIFSRAFFSACISSPLMASRAASKAAWSALNCSASRPTRRISTALMTSSLAMVSTTFWPSTTWPNTVWRSSRCGVATWVMKNWLPFVPGPALAMESTPGPSWRSVLSNSSGKV